MSITKEQLAEWKALEAKATKGPWAITNLINDGNTRLEIAFGDGSPMGFYDAEFCCTARTAVPALIAEVERLQDALEQKTLELVSAQASNDQLRVIMEVDRLKVERLQDEIRSIRQRVHLGHHKDEMDFCVMGICADVPKTV